jgi:hypothetical protein
MRKIATSAAPPRAYVRAFRICPSGDWMAV